MRTVKLDQIKIDGGTQCRVVLDQKKIYEYKERMEENDEFPLIETVFDGATHWLTDGFHRYHAYRLLGVKAVEVKYKSGTHEDAILEAVKANSKHGLPLTNEDKRNKVKMLLELPSYAEKSTYEIAKFCGLSQSFVASIRDEKTKEKQVANRQKSSEKKAEERKNTSPTSIEPDSHDGEAPEDNEIKAAEMAQQENIRMMNELLESNEPLKLAYAEIERLNQLHATLELRRQGLIRERDEAIKMVKKLQKELDTLKGKK